MRKTGILIAAGEFRDEGSLPVEEHKKLRRTLDWFNKHLPVPKTLNEDGNERALSWFKPSAKNAVRKAWDLKALLDQYDLHIEVHKTNDPGIIIYEDEMQVVAKPRKGQKLS